jgi:D-alanyl-lipoteichoic acid acyltransferase DltB (MBOAT superfamily)
MCTSNINTSQMTTLSPGVSIHLHPTTHHPACKCICRLGSGGVILGATLWLVFILLLIYGLYSNRAAFVLAHLIACVSALVLFLQSHKNDRVRINEFIYVQLIVIVLLIAKLTTAIVGGTKLIDISSSVWTALAIASLIWVEWRCYQYLKDEPSAPTAALGGHDVWPQFLIELLNAGTF